MTSVLTTILLIAIADVVLHPLIRRDLRRAAYRQQLRRMTALTIRIRVETEWVQLTERQRFAQAEVDVLRSEVLPGAESAWQAATTGFELGKFSFLDALDAQRTLLQARAQYLRALNELYRTNANIDRLLGTSGEEQTTSKP